MIPFDIRNNSMAAGITNRGSLVQHVFKQVVHVIVHLSTVDAACKYVETVN